MKINELVKEAHENAVKHGWWEEDRNFGEQIALMHSELSEALEEFRNGHEVTETYYSYSHCAYSFKPETCKGVGVNCNTCGYGKPEGIPIELADCIIRIFDTCGRYGIGLENALKIKMEYNKNRPYKHGEKKI